MIHKIRIEGVEDAPTFAHIFVDDKQIHGVRSYELRHDALNIPVLTLHMGGRFAPTIEEFAVVEHVTPEAVEEAISVLKLLRQDDHERFTEAIREIYKEWEDG